TNDACAVGGALFKPMGFRCRDHCAIHQSNRNTRLGSKAHLRISTSGVGRRRRLEGQAGGFFRCTSRSGANLPEIQNSCPNELAQSFEPAFSPRKNPVSQLMRAFGTDDDMHLLIFLQLCSAENETSKPY